MNDELKYIQKYSTSINTSFGYKNDEELLAYFLECDFVVLPYKEASQSGVLLTALTLGKPVIATKVGALPEVVNIVKGGYIIYPNNPDLLFKAMDKASNIPRDELVKWGKNIRKKTFENYSWDNIAKITLNFYRDLSNN
jgi:glycosyltransferase involved in cell wall biosynthesis